ncbi:hypothetical protein HWV00_03125 [Moritella sp. 24]|nr:hypothetical protein HWV00_03125 [Moritella sp. 24]
MKKISILIISLASCFSTFAAQANSADDAWDASKDAMGEAWNKTKEATEKAMEAAKSKTDELLEDSADNSDEWLESLKQGAEAGWDKTKKKVEELQKELDEAKKSSSEDETKETQPTPEAAPIDNAIPEWQKA